MATSRLVGIAWGDSGGEFSSPAIGESMYAFEERYRGDSASTLANSSATPRQSPSTGTASPGTVAVEAFSYRPSLTRPILANAPV